MSSFYNLSFLKEYNFVLYTCRSTTPLNITWQCFEWSENYCHKSEEELVQTIDQFWIENETLWSGIVSSKHHTYGKVLPSNMENHICGTICMQSHPPISWYWLVAEWHQNCLASDLLKEIRRTTIMSNVIRGHVCRGTHPRIRLYYMARQRCTRILLWGKYVSTTRPTWWLTWVLITLCIMIGSLAMPGYSMPGSRIWSQTSWEHDIRRMNIIHMEKFCHQRWKIIYVAQSVCKAIHQGPGTCWLPIDIKNSWRRTFWKKL